MELANFNELLTAFASGDMKHLPRNITVDGMVYRKGGGTKLDMAELVEGSTRGVVVYRISSDEQTQQRFKELHVNADEGPQDRILFSWIAQQLRVIQYRVENLSKNRILDRLNESVDVDHTDSDIDTSNRTILSDTEEIQLIGFNQNNAIEARVDTGAGQCSLHAEQIKTSDELVEFTFNGKRYRMNITGNQGVSSSDGGEETRPVVTFGVKLGGQVFEGISFNLNDRSNMPHKILIGQNLLEQGRFLIDPTKEKMDEDMTDDEELALFENYFNSLEIDLDELQAENILESLHLGDLTLKDIITYRLEMEQNDTAD